MDIRKIRKLIELLKETGISEIEIKEGEESLRLSCLPHAHSNPAPMAVHTAHIQVEQPNTPVEKAQDNPGYHIKAPMVGTIYLAASPESAPFVHIGKQVNVGDTLCIIEAMKMFNEIEADKAGVLKTILVDNGTPVEF